MKKKVFATAVAAMLALTGCSSGSSSSTASASASATAAATATGTAEVDLSNVSEDTLVVYTNSGSDGRGDWLVEQAAEAGFNIVYVSLGAAELTNRLVAEKNNQIADVVWGLNAVEYEKLKNEDMLIQYTPAWADEVDQEGYGDPEGYYWPIAVQPLLCVYNPEYVTGDQIPSDWTDLATMWPDQYMIHPLTGGTAKTVFSSILVRYQDDSAPEENYGISDEGWEVARAFIENGYVTSTNEAYWDYMDDGSMPLLEMWGSGLLLNEASRGKDYSYILPEVGEPVVVEQLAIFKDSEKQELAKEFIDWMGSAEVQAAFSENFGTTPANTVALETCSDEIKALMADITPQDIDWTFVAENVDNWVEKATLEFDF